MIKLLCIIEIANAQDEETAQDRLDRFREQTLPAQRYGLTIYRATDEDMAKVADLHILNTK